ncbi:MAG TPA: family 16 glycoside hydrolase [Candidatus Sulfomarinibacteraceae bacterium]|nr:family 16 glycoside hydrolase [Candidatus Sulfomarinibacteraceae bacterium]
MAGRARSFYGSSFLSFLLLTISFLSGCRTQPAGEGIPLGSEVIFSDEFDEGASGPWRLEGDDLSRATIADGHLLLAVNAPSSVHYVTLTEPSFSDFVLQVDATQLAGNPASSYGILARIAGEQQFYRFEVTGSGEYTVERHDGPGTYERLTDGWETSSALQTGVGATNRLVVVAAGSSLSFYANEDLLTRVNDGRYQAGTIALDAGTFGQGDLQVAFDNVRISRP